MHTHVTGHSTFRLWRRVPEPSIFLDPSGLKFESGKRFLIAISEFYRQSFDEPRILMLGGAGWDSHPREPGFPRPRE